MRVPDKEPMNKFKVGDIVKLKSGGPALTVEEIRGDTVLVFWFDKLKLKKTDFKAAMLEAA